MARLSQALGVLALVAALVVVAPLPAPAQVEAVYTVTSVAVDQTAQSAAQAREAAMADGQRKALRRLIDRLVARADARKVQVPSGARLADLIESFEVESERSSPVRYIGSLTIRFNPDGVRNLFRQAGVAFAETQARPLVVLPLLQGDAGPLLWENDNTWREAWASATATEGLVPLIVPVGDLADVGTVTAQQAEASDTAALEALAQANNAGGTVVAAAKLRPPGRGAAGPTVEIALSGVAADLGGLPTLDPVAARRGEELPALLTRAAAAVADQIQDAWKAKVVVRTDREGRLQAAIAVQSLGDWVRVRQALADVPAVKRSELLSIGRSEAIVEILYSGDESQLAVALAQRDLQLSRDAQRWRLRLGRAP